NAKKAGFQRVLLIVISASTSQKGEYVRAKAHVRIFVALSLGERKTCAIPDSSYLHKALSMKRNSP
ncbi:MAG TPA: hypothetical protein VIK82_08065, partial [Porticoccaceae bacterium]